MQIARIAATTVVAPAGMYNAADDGSASKSEEHVGKEWTELADVDSWVHIRQHLKKQGKTCDPFQFSNRRGRRLGEVVEEGSCKASLEVGTRVPSTR